jgi:ribose transport system ATP-binding protein
MQDSNLAPVLEMVGITKSFPGVRALDGVSLAVLPGQVHALMGENGAGKSTLMKILAGAQRADSGEIRLQGQAVTIDTPHRAMELGVGIIYQELNLVPHLTVAENLFLGREPRFAGGFVNRRKLRNDALAVIDGLGGGMEPDELVGGLSLAQRQMVEIGKATSRNCRVIAMDEPSATLTEHELDNLWRLIRTLTAKGIGIVYISHRMDEVFAIADALTVMRDGKTVATSRIGEISRDQVLRQMVGRDLDESFPKEVVPVGDPVLEVRGLNRRGVLHDISFTVRAGEVVALAGLVGAGRTEVARCIFGVDPCTVEEMRVAGKPFTPHSPGAAIDAGIGFVTEDRKDQGVILSMAIRENVSLASMDKVSHAGFIDWGEEREEARSSVKRLSVRTPGIEQSVGNLSGGNQQKVVIAKWLQTSLKVLILDEPTRGIDVGAKREIYQIMNQLTADGVAILMISSELPEVLGMADRILVMRGGRIVGEVARADATQEAVGRLAIADA